MFLKVFQQSVFFVQTRENLTLGLWNYFDIYKNLME